MRIVLVYLFSFLFLFGGCSGREDRLINWMQKENITMTKMITKTYSDTEIEEIVKFEGSLKKLNSAYEIEYIRDNNGIGYKIYYWGESVVGFIGYDYFGKNPTATTFSISSSKSEFDALIIGVDTLDSVREIDPEGNYIFLYTGVRIPSVSGHFTSDGYDIDISYDDNNVITGIDVKQVKP